MKLFELIDNQARENNYIMNKHSNITVTQMFSVGMVTQLPYKHESLMVENNYTDNEHHVMPLQFFDHNKRC